MKFNKYTGKFYPEDSDFEAEDTPATILVTIFGCIMICVIIALVL